MLSLATDHGQNSLDAAVSQWCHARQHVGCLIFTRWDAPTKMQPGVIDIDRFIDNYIV